MNNYLKTSRDVRVALAERVRAERLRQNITQEKLAEGAGISLSTLRRFESTGDITLKDLTEIAFVLRRLDGFESLFSIPPVQTLFEPQPVERKRARKSNAS